MMKTVGNSRPLAVCRVIRTTLESSSVSSSWSATRLTASRNCSMVSYSPATPTSSADDAVGNADPHELLLDDPALGVRAVEDGHVAPAVGLVVVQVLHLLAHPARLVVLVLGEVPLDELPAHLLGPQGLGLAHEVV